MNYHRAEKLIDHLEDIHYLHTQKETLPENLKEFAETVVTNCSLLSGGIASRQVAAVVYSLYQVGLLKGADEENE